MTVESVDIPQLLAGLTAHHRTYLKSRFGISFPETPSAKDLELFVQLGLFLLTREQIKGIEAKVLKRTQKKSKKRATRKKRRK